MRRGVQNSRRTTMWPNSS